jgi:Fusaric acid resistance protein family
VTATTSSPPTFAWIPADSWAFGVRIWIAVVIALAAGFWLELDAPSTAAVTVAILALPTRGQVLEKACFRLLATIVGIVAAIAISGLFSQARDLVLAAFAGWLGLCIYVSGLLDGNRAYAAVLSGYTVGIVAIEQLDAPGQVFQTAVARGSAIGVGIAAMALVNVLFAAPASDTQVGIKLNAIHRRIRAYAKTVIRGETTDAGTAIDLLRDAASLRSDLAKPCYGIGRPIQERRGKEHGGGVGGGAAGCSRPERLADDCRIFPGMDLIRTGPKESRRTDDFRRLAARLRIGLSRFHVRPSRLGAPRIATARR